MIKFIIFIAIIFLNMSCGFKATPTPVFPTSMQKQIDDEIARRNQEPKENSLQQIHDKDLKK